MVYLYIAFAQALFASLGSLLFSEILHFPPCTLCWYQRAFMYPLVIILAVAISKKDPNVLAYATPFAIIGWLIAAYHVLLYYGIIPQSLAPCSQGVSCTTKFIEYFGFITIPFLSLTAFTVILLSLYLYRQHQKNSASQG